MISQGNGCKRTFVGRFCVRAPTQRVNVLATVCSGYRAVSVTFSLIGDDVEKSIAK